MKRVGERGKANIEARKLIAKIAEERGLNHCEMQLDGCLGNWPLAPAHRHKRAFYQGNVELLSDYKQWVCACQNCHDLTEHNRELNDKVFYELRGEE